LGNRRLKKELCGLQNVVLKKTKAEAQAIVDGEVAKAQAAYDALPEDQKQI
jgi:hypothetical protein